MKKSFRFAAIATLVLAAAGTITFVACNKKSEVINNLPQAQSIQYSEMDKAMLAFGEKMASSERGEETMPLEEAIKTLTNYQNFAMCNANNHMGKKTDVKVVSTIHVENGNVTMAELNKLYENNRKQILDSYNSIEEQNKNIYFIISIIDNDSRDDNDVTITTTARMLERGQTPNNPNINNTDFWHPCDEQGKCGSYEGQYIGQDAMTRLGYVLYAISSFPGPIPGYHMYYSNFNYHWLIAGQYIDTNSPNGHYGLIDAEYDSDCLSPSDMCYYRDSALDKIDEWIMDEQLYNRVLIDVYYTDVACSAMLGAHFAHVEYTYIGNND